MYKTLTTTLLLTLALGACKSTGVDQSEQAAQAMRQMYSALKDAPDKITAVSASLSELVTEGGDMKAEFATFSSNVNSLVSHRERIRGLSKEVESNKQVVTEEWDKRLKTIKDESLRQRAEERRAGLVKEFAEVDKVASAGREEFEPWMQKVLDVRTYLESDLNPGGVASVSDTAKEISAGAESVNGKITTVVSELEKIAQQIAATKPPPPAPEEGQPEK